jgi:hypothetical protein
MEINQARRNRSHDRKRHGHKKKNAQIEAAAHRAVHGSGSTRTGVQPGWTQQHDGGEHEANDETFFDHQSKHFI